MWGVRQAVRDIVASRHIIVRLFWRDFIAQFRQKILGYVWALLTPLFSIVSFLFLYAIGVLRPGEGTMPYPVYVLIGSTVWGCLPGAMAAVSGGLTAQADLIMRTRIPKLALAVSALAGFFYTIMTNMLTLGIVFALMHVTPSWWFLLYPLLVLPLTLVGVAMGLVLSVLGSIARDLTPLVTQILGLVMYLTPVIYVQSSVQNPFVQKLIQWNPLTYLVDLPRTLVGSGTADNIGMFALMSIGAVLVLCVAVRIFYLLEDLVAERL